MLQRRESLEIMKINNFKSSYIKIAAAIMTVALSIVLIVPSIGRTAAADFTMTYLYGGTEVTYSNYIGRTQGMLDAISPDYFSVTPGGTLIIEKVSKAFVSQAHNAGLKVIPFISNHWDRPSGIAALNNKEALTTQIANAVNEYGLDGVDVDIENVSHEYRNSYTAFVKMLREKTSGQEYISCCCGKSARMDNRMARML